MSDCRFQWRHLVTFSDEAIRGVKIGRRLTCLETQPKNNRGTNAEPSGFQSGGSPCRRLKKATRKKRNRRQTKTSLRPMCRPTRRRKVRASRPAARSRKKPDAFGFIIATNDAPHGLGGQRIGAPLAREACSISRPLCSHATVPRISCILHRPNIRDYKFLLDAWIIFIDNRRGLHFQRQIGFCARINLIKQISVRKDDGQRRQGNQN